MPVKFLVDLIYSRTELKKYLGAKIYSTQKIYTKHTSKKSARHNTLLIKWVKCMLFIWLYDCVVEKPNDALAINHGILVYLCMYTRTHAKGKRTEGKRGGESGLFEMVICH